MTDKKKNGEPTYAEASAELDAILQEVESGEIDLDLLAEKVERAAALLSLCRARLATTETKVRKVVADLQAATGTDDDAGRPAGHDGEDER